MSKTNAVAADCTPQGFFEELDREFHFTLDAAATEWSAKCPRYYTPETDGLHASWVGETVFCHPPTDNVESWAHKCYEEGQQPGTTVVLLAPAKTETSYFHDFILGKCEIRFIKGRLILTDNNGNKGGRPATGSLLAIYKGAAQQPAHLAKERPRADRRVLILEILGDRQMTASELTEELLAKGYIKYYDRNFVAPRLTELKEAGLVMTVGKRICKRTGKNVAVWSRKEQRRDI